MKITVKKVETTVKIDGTSFPVLNYRLILQKNGLPNLSMGISMGSNMTAKGAGKAVDMTVIKEGAKVEFLSKVGGQNIIFNGVVKSSQLNVKLSNVSTSSGNYNVTAEHSLARIGGLPILDRLFVGAGRQKGSGLDAYRERLLDSKDEATAAIMRIMAGSFLKDGYENLLSTSSTSTIPGLVIKVLKALYASEADTVAESAHDNRLKDKEAIAELDKLEKNIVGGVPNKDVTTRSDRSEFVEALVGKLAANWANSNGLELLIQAMSSIFYCVAPKQNGDIMLRQDCPVYSKEDYTIDNKYILGIGHNDMYNAVPITGIRIRVPLADNNEGAPASRMEYIQFPNKGESGIYQYMSTHKFDMWFRFSSIYDQQKSPKNKDAATESTYTKNSTGDTEEVTDQKEEDAKPDGEADAERKLWIDIGKAAYATQKWRNSSIVLSIAHVPTIEVGDIIKIDLSKADALADNIPRGTYFGNVDTIAFSGAPGKVTMQVNITNVRNKEENDKYGFKEYPIYEKPN